MSTSALARSVALFVVAGLLEIGGGGYLVWLWLREHRGVALGALGGLVKRCTSSVSNCLELPEEPAERDGR